MGKKTILCIEDDEATRTMLQIHLEDEGFLVLAAEDSVQAKNAAQTNAPDIILLDLSLKDGSSLPLIATLKPFAKAGLIIVSGKADTTEKVVGLEMGADDYVTKPFVLRELTARINALLRRQLPQTVIPTTANDQTPLQVYFDGWCLDRGKFQVFSPAGVSANLTSGEFKLLDALITANGRACTREHLFDLTRDAEYDSYDRAVDIQIGRLRKKLDPEESGVERIKTIRGVGYMFVGSLTTA